MKPDIKKLLPHVLAVLIFIGLTLIFFLPVLDGKDLQQSDMAQAAGMQHEVEQFEKQTGELSLWTNAMFSGMPTYQIYKGGSPYNVFSFLFKVIRLGLPFKTIGVLFCYLLCFYILLISLRFNPWLAAIGAIAFCFASYNIIIVEVGHVTKAYAIAFIPLVVAGVFKIFEEKYLLGFILLSLGFGVEVYTNHPQITYYLGICLLVYFIVQFIYAVRSKTYKPYFKKTLFTGAAVILGLLPNITLLWTTYEYGKYSLRGPSELSVKAGEQKSTGLDRDYAFGWSYGKAETGTFIIPNFMGGSSGAALGLDSKTYKTLQANNVPNANEIVQRLPMYWGDQPSTSGPVYFGAIVCFLFVLGLFLVKGPEKWWLLSITLLSIIMSWGRNFEVINDFLFYNFPLYNKFRAVSMALVIAGFTVPFLGFLALKRIFNNELAKPEIIKGIKNSFYITGGFTLLFALLPGLFFDFSSSSDAQLTQSGFPDWLLAAIRSDREGLLRSDAFRSFIFIVLGGAAIWAYVAGKLKVTYAYVVLGALMLFDLVPVGKRYLTKDNFTAKKDVSVPYQPTQADLDILQDKDPNYRVINFTVSPFMDASTSYFHKSIGGYHGAKLRRYQELWEAHIVKNNFGVLNMLNTKYFIVAGEDRVPRAQRNPGALGNAWFVEQVKLVDNADQELAALDSTFDPLKTAVVDKRFNHMLAAFKPVEKDTSGNETISLQTYKPNHLTYVSNARSQQLAVFSEIFYDKGWNAFIDGQPAPYFRANYVLRAMLVPPGQHTIEFKFEPSSYHTGNKITIVASALFVLLVVAAIVMQLRKKSETPVAGNKK